MDILVIDDNANAAATFASLIRRGTELEAGSTDDPGTALDLVETEPIAVVVLDQRMPRIAGTELFDQIHKLDPAIHAIMLTAEADRAEVGKALNAGFAAFLSKKDVQRLPSLVLEHFIDFHTQRAIEAERHGTEKPTSLKLRDGLLGRLRRSRLSVAVVRADILDVETTPDDAWFTIESVDAGETLTTLSEAVHHDTVMIQREDTKTHGGHLSIPGIHSITPALKREIERKVSRRSSQTRLARRAVERTLTLPSEVQNRDAPQLRSRNRQEAPSCTKVRVTLKVSCTCCKQHSFATLLAYVHDGTYLTRQIDHYSDGESRIVNTAHIS